MRPLRFDLDKMENVIWGMMKKLQFSEPNTRKLKERREGRGEG